MDISYKVPENINWYEANGEYFVVFHPEIFYWAKEILDGESTDYEWYDIEDDYWDYYQMSKQNIQLKITNLKDGSEFASISILDDKGIIGFNDSAYHESASWNGELLAKHVSYLKIENLSSNALYKISVFETDYYDRLENETLQVGENYVFKHTYHSEFLVEDIPQKIDMDYRMIFSLDNQYYCINTQKQYDTKVYNVPDISIHLNRVGDEGCDTYTYTFDFENNTDKILENFCVLFIEKNKLQPSFEKCGEYMLYGTFNPGDVWQFPFEFPPTKNICFIAGYLEEGTLYHKSFSTSLSFIDEEGIASKSYTFNSNLEYGEQTIDVYYLFNDIKITHPTPSSDSTATLKNTSKPLVTTVCTPPKPTPMITVAPTSSSASVIKVVETESYYIPKWVWVVLIASLTIIIVLVMYITIKNNKDR